VTAPAVDAWAPDAFTWQRGVVLQGRIPYAAGTTLAADGETTQKPIPPAVQAFGAWLASWPGIRSVGTRRSPAKPSTAGRQRDIHEEGRALDAMIAAPNTAEGNAAGDALAAFLVENADRLGVQGVVWRRREWYSSRTGAAWENYAGADGHTSHPHIELSPAVAGEGGDAMRARIAAVVAAPARPSGGAGWGVALLGAASAGALAWMLARLARRR
jgi:hypothetical protein